MSSEGVRVESTLRHSASLRAALRLYAITPEGSEETDEILARAERAIEGGVTALQLRGWRFRESASAHARAAAIRALCRRLGALFIVNDDPGLAVRLDADGVHVGPHDATVAEARRVVGPDRIVGGSAGNLERALQCVAQGADYLGVGAIHDARATKAEASPPRGPDFLREFRRHDALRHLPIVAIGGIEATTAGACVAAGADGVAAVRALLGSTDPFEAAAAFRRAMSAGGASSEVPG